MEIRCSDDLIREYKRTHPKSHYFDEETLEFFGESLETMRLEEDFKPVIDAEGEIHSCYVLNCLQEICPGGARIVPAYFDTETLDEVIT